MQPQGRELGVLLAERGVTRRELLRFAATVAGVLALPPAYGRRIARAITQARRVPVIWLEGQDCAGNSEALLRSSRPTVAELILDMLSLDHHELLMAPAGAAAERSARATVEANPGGYIVVVEGSVPLADGGVYCMVGGRTFASIVEEVCRDALATIAVGACAWDGGLPAARGGVTGAVGVEKVLSGGRLINLPGCPMNPDNLTAVIVHYLTFGEFPPTDSAGRPLFAYGDVIHERCERLDHYNRREFVRAWGDEGHRRGWCLFQMGCKGPATLANCPVVRFNSGTSWPVAAGHGCIGCTMPAFWDATPAYQALPGGGRR